MFDKSITKINELFRELVLTRTMFELSIDLFYGWKWPRFYNWSLHAIWLPNIKQNHYVINIIIETIIKSDPVIHFAIENVLMLI